MKNPTKASVFVPFLLATFLFSCNVNSLTPNVFENNSSTFSKELRSSVNSDIIKKSFLKINNSSFKTLAEGSSDSISRNLYATKTDLKRKFIVNIKSDTNKFNPSELAIKINNKNLTDNSAVNENVSDVSFLIDNIVEGDNNFEVLKSKNDFSNLSVDVVGFVDPVDIPRAIHSRIPDNAEVRKGKYKKGKVGIKFREGMKVKFEDASKKSLKDESGISLTLLKKFVKDRGIKNIYKSVGDDNFSIELDNDEKKAETLFSTEVANLNLFYYLEVDEKEDVWKLVDDLRKLPFIEEAFPEFEMKPAASIVLNDPELVGTTSQFQVDGGFSYQSVPKDKWLRMAHIQSNTANEPGEDDDGAWIITRGKKDIKIAAIGYGAEVNSLETPYIKTSHSDLSNVIQISNVNVPSTNNYTDLSHGTATIGVIGATGNNSIGVAGVAHNAQSMYIQGYATGFPSKCLGTGIANCDAGVDSLYLAKNKGARVISIEVGGSYTVEEENSLYRSAIANLVANGITVCLPACNDNHNDIRFFNGFPMPDTGSIVVGSLIHDGSRNKSYYDTTTGLYKSYNYGKSLSGGSNALYTNSGHGIDVSAIGEGVWMTSQGNTYNNFRDTSAATPTIAGVVALMLSVKPDLTPLEIRKTLRETSDTTNIDNSQIPGMVNAYQAVHKYYGTISSLNTVGLFAKFYKNTLFPPEANLNSLSNDATSQENNVPYFTKVLSSDGNLNSSSYAGFSNIGLSYDYTADIQGLINATTAGNYNFALYHDDTAILKINGNEVINKQNASDNYTYAYNVPLSWGENAIQIIRSQNIGTANTVLWWQPPGGAWSIVPANALYHAQNLVSPIPQSVYNTGLIGRFFTKTTIPFSNSMAKDLGYMGSKIYPNLNYQGGVNLTGDQFGIGRSDNFSGYFSGVLKLPAGYANGTYTIKIGHDDGMVFYFNGQLRLNYPTSSAYTTHSTVVSLTSGINYPFAIHYDELTGGAELKMSWVKPNGVEEVIPATAFFH